MKHKCIVRKSTANKKLWYVECRVCPVENFEACYTATWDYAIMVALIHYVCETYAD